MGLQGCLARSSRRCRRSRPRRILLKPDAFEGDPLDWGDCGLAREDERDIERRFHLGVGPCIGLTAGEDDVCAGLGVFADAA